MATIIIVLDLWMPLWLAALITTVLYAAAAAVLALRGRDELKQTGAPIPEQDEGVRQGGHPVGEDTRAIEQQIEDTRERMGDTVAALSLQGRRARPHEGVGVRQEARGDRASCPSAKEAVDRLDRRRAVQRRRRLQPRRRDGAGQPARPGDRRGGASASWSARCCPARAVEEERIGPVADHVREQVSDVASEAVEHGKQVAQDAAEAATDAAKESGSAARRAAARLGAGNHPLLGWRCRGRARSGERRRHRAGRGDEPRPRPVAFVHTSASVESAVVAP